MTSTAAKTLSLPEISHLFWSAARAVVAFDHMADKDPRQKALTIAQSLVATLKTPDEMLMRHASELSS